MVFVSKKEQLLLDMMAKKDAVSSGKFLDALKKMYVHYPERLLDEKFDKKMTEEFLRELIKHQEDKGIEKYNSVVTKDDTAHTLGEKCLAPNDLQDNILKSLGSYGLTKLIEAGLEKMTKSKFGEKEIASMVMLIESRNKLRQHEENFLNTAFKAYLKKQISLYE